jgi:hypothetical protein
LPGVEINLLHATSASLQRISTHQSVWPIESSASMGTWFSGDLSQPTLPFMVWLWRGFEVPRKTCLHKHHSVPSHITATDCLLHTACCLPADWKIHHSHCMFLQLTLSFDTYIIQKFLDLDIFVASSTMRCFTSWAPSHIYFTSTEFISGI